MRSEQGAAAMYEVQRAGGLGAEHALRVPSLLRCGLTIALVKSLLRIRGFGPTIEWVRDRATRVPIADRVDDSMATASERKVALACALYPGRAQCLERSLVLYYLLRRQGVGVRFITGVKVDPFGAHAWVQYRNEPINDVAEHVALYTALPDARS
jgi:hypothetical protein